MKTPEEPSSSIRRADPFLPYTLRSLPWALPFALFFWLLNGAHRALALSFLEVSFVFTLVIRTALWMVQAWAVPRLYANREPSEVHWLLPGALYTVAGIGGAVLASALSNLLIWHGFMGGPLSWVVSMLFALVFSIMFGGIAYAQAFQRQAAERGAQVERIRSELARAELRALRAQVNPHFLFNTLNSIASLIAEDPRAAEEVVTQLAEVFRYALTSSDGDTARLGDELAFLRSYLAIEQVRLGERLRVVEHIDPALLAAAIPPLLLQPLVENAVRYAVAARTKGGTITIEARREAGALVMVVADDGPGFTEGAAPQGHGVGLESVRERMRLAGAGHAFAIDTAPGSGTRITLTLPLFPGTTTKSHSTKQAPPC